MNKYLINGLFIIGVLGFIYSTDWEWNTISSFISGGLVGIWITLQIKKRYTKK